MAGRLEGKVAFITGAARGQGRAHAVRMAEEGADIIAIDIAEPIEGVPYALGSTVQLTETVELVEALDRRIVTRVADVRDSTAVAAAVEEGVAEFGRLDIVVANAGISSFGAAETLSGERWQTMLDVNLTGAWHTAKAAIPALRAAGGGSMIFTSSIAGLRALPNLAHYVAAKHGVLGLMKTLALELAPHRVRVNAVLPGNVDTYMTNNPVTFQLFGPDLSEEERTREALLPRFQEFHALPEPFLDPVDIANAAVFLASDEARYITGVALPVDAGTLVK